MVAHVQSAAELDLMANSEVSEHSAPDGLDLYTPEKKYAVFVDGLIVEVTDRDMNSAIISAMNHVDASEHSRSDFHTTLPGIAVSFIPEEGVVRPAVRRDSALTSKPTNYSSNEKLCKPSDSLFFTTGYKCYPTETFNPRHGVISGVVVREMLGPIPDFTV